MHGNTLSTITVKAIMKAKILIGANIALIYGICGAATSLQNWSLNR